MSKLLVSVLCVVGFTSACNHHSEDFHRSSKLAYQLMLAAANGGSVTDHDIELAIASAKTDSRGDGDKAALEYLEQFHRLLFYLKQDLGTGSASVCVEEGGIYFGASFPPTRHMGDCKKAVDGVHEILIRKIDEEAKRAEETLEQSIKENALRENQMRRANKEFDERMKRLRESDPMNPQ